MQKSIIEQIKERSSILEIAIKLVPGLKQSGSHYVGSIRDERTPALTIYPKTQSWYHFVSTDTTPKGRQGGDIIDLVEYVKQSSTREAVAYLAQEYGIQTEPLTSEEEAKVARTRRCQEILTAAARAYNSRLVDDPEAESVREYLAARGIVRETWQEYLIGYSGSGSYILSQLELQGFSKTEILQTGLMSKDGVHDYFQSRIIFPLIKNGRVGYMTGRKTGKTPSQPWEEPKYKHLPISDDVANNWFYNEDSLVGAKEVIVCEGIPDCLTLAQWEIPAVGLLGNHIKDELIDKLLRSEQVYLALDVDGKSDPLAIAKRLYNKSRILTLPKFENGDGSMGKDINEFILSGKNKDDFTTLMLKAKTVLEFQLPEHLQKYRVEESLSGEVIVKLGDLAFEVSRIREEEDKGLRGMVRFFKEGLLQHSDFVTFSSSMARSRFAKMCLDKQDESSIKNSAKILLEIESIIKFRDGLKLRELEKIKTVSVPALTEEQRSQAQEKLKSPTLLADICALRPLLLVAGEEENWLIIYLSITSRLLNRPISLVPKGLSGAGKSHTTGQCLKLFPPTAYIDITDATARSFYHVETTAYKHKMIVLFEKHGMEQSDYSIRSLQSEGKLKLQITIQDPQTGEFHAEVKEVEGPTGFITTTTDPRIHAENETRNFSLYVDETESQTARTFEMTDARYRGVLEMPAAELELWQMIQRPEILKPCRVLIPYVEKIREVFPKNPIRVRRDYGRFLSLVEASAVLHQCQRRTISVNSQEYIVAEVTDYAAAKIIAEKILRETIYELPGKCKDIFQAAKILSVIRQTPINENPTFTITEIAEEIKQDYDTAWKWINPLVDKGYFKVVEAGRGRKSALYSLTGKNPTVEGVILPSIASLWQAYGSEDSSLPYNPISGEPVSLEEDKVKEPDPLDPEAIEALKYGLSFAEEQQKSLY